MSQTVQILPDGRPRAFSGPRGFHPCMKRTAVLVTTLLTFLTLTPLAAAEPDLVREARGCANAWLYGGDYNGDYLQCSGIGIIPLVTDNQLVKDVLGCAKAIITGGEYWGPYLQCGGA